MHTNEERIDRMHSRAAELCKEKMKRKTRAVQAATFSLCFAASVFVAEYIYSVKDRITGITVTKSLSASVFSDSGIIGAIVTAIIAFLLGISVTVFCYRLKKRQDENVDGENK